MTSSLTTSHTRSPKIAHLVTPNVPVCRNPTMVYEPSQVESTVNNDGVTIIAKWDNGVSGEDHCSPVTVTVEVKGDDVNVEAVRHDIRFGYEEPVIFRPMMVSGLIASIHEHFEGHPGAEIGPKEAISIEPNRITKEVGRQIQGLVSRRSEEVLAPCAVPSVETNVGLPVRRFEMSQR